MASEVRVVVLTEDSSPSAFDVWRPLVRLLARATTECDTSKVVPERPVPEIARIMAANRWRNRLEDARPLVRAIATQLRAGRLVFFHRDGDEPWARRERSTAASDFQRQIEARVASELRHLALTSTGGPRERRRHPPPTSTPDVDATIAKQLQRLRLVCPYYAIEAWLFQSTRKAIELCQARHASRPHIEEFERWAADRTLLDELTRPGEHPCLGKGNNAVLAAALTNAIVEQVVAADRSLAETVRRLQASPAIVVALRSTRDA